MTNKSSLYKENSREGLLINIILSAAGALFIIGVLSPFLTVTKFYLFTDKISILSGLGQLISQGEIVLFVIIALFTIILPVAKITYMGILLNGNIAKKDKRRKLLNIIHIIGKWSMLDIFVVAILLISIKTGILVQTEIHYGLYAFLCSIILTMIVTSRVVKMVDKP